MGVVLGAHVRVIVLFKDGSFHVKKKKSHHFTGTVQVRAVAKSINLQRATWS